MDQLAHHYRAHIAELNRRVAEILSREALSGLVIHSGQPHRMFWMISIIPLRQTRTSRHGCLCWIIRIVG